MTESILTGTTCAPLFRALERRFDEPTGHGAGIAIFQLVCREERDEPLLIDQSFAQFDRDNLANPRHRQCGCNYAESWRLEAIGRQDLLGGG